MQTIFKNIDLNDELPTCTKISYKERSKNITFTEIKEKLQNNFTENLIKNILDIYFDYIDHEHNCNNKTYRGVMKYIIIAGATYYVCKDINIVLQLFTEIPLYNTNKIYKFANEIEKHINNKANEKIMEEYDYYDELSTELIFK